MGKRVLLLFLPLLLMGCTPKAKDTRLAWQITFFPLGAKVRFHNEASIERISAFNSDRMLVAQLNFPVPPRQIESLYFEWNEGEPYRFEAAAHPGQISVQTVNAPRVHARGSLEVAIPYGAAMQTTTDATESKALVLQGSEMTATVIVTNGNAPATFEVELCLPATLDVVQLPVEWKTETSGAETCLSTTGTFGVASEVWYRELVLKIPDLPIAEAGLRPGALDSLQAANVGSHDAQKISGIVRFKTDTEQTWEQRAEVQLHSATVAEIAEYLSIESIQMPTDMAGIADARRRTDTIYYPRPLFSWLKMPQTDAFEPIAYQTVRIRNQSQETIHVVVSSINRDAKSGEAVGFLAPPDAVNAGTDRSISFASLPGGEVTAIPLPLYFHPQFAVAGEYERDIEVKVWGSDATILREQRPLHLIVPNRHALFVSGIAIIASCIGLIVLLRFHKQFFARFTTKQLIVIALFGTTIFVVVIVPSTLFLNLIRALLGPASVLLTGLMNETLYYALLTALLIYINGAPGTFRVPVARGPRASQIPNDTVAPGEEALDLFPNRGSPAPTYGKSALRNRVYNKKRQHGGVILLVSAVRLLLGGVTFGLFTPMAIIYTGTSVLLLETGFLLVQRRGLLAWALVLGICDAIAVYVDFQLSILFYRLFYADWYIILRILVEGFAYTFIGVLLGARLGRGLWRVAD